MNTVSPPDTEELIERTARGDASARQQRPQFFQGATHAFLGGLFGGAKRSSDLVQALLAKEAQDNRVAVALVQFGEGGVDVRQRVFLEGIFVLAAELHSGLFFPSFAAGLGSKQFQASEMNRPVQPARDDGLRTKAPGLAGQGDESGLRGLFGQMRVPELAQGHRINEVAVADDQFPECVLRALTRIGIKQVHIIELIHNVISIYPMRSKKGQGDGREPARACLSMSTSESDCQRGVGDGLDENGDGRKKRRRSLTAVAE